MCSAENTRFSTAASCCSCSGYSFRTYNRQKRRGKGGEGACCLALIESADTPISVPPGLQLRVPVGPCARPAQLPQDRQLRRGVGGLPCHFVPLRLVGGRTGEDLMKLFDTIFFFVSCLAVALSPPFFLSSSFIVVVVVVVVVAFPSLSATGRVCVCWRVFFWSGCSCSQRCSLHGCGAIAVTSITTRCANALVACSSTTDPPGCEGGGK